MARGRTRRRWSTRRKLAVQVLLLPLLLLGVELTYRVSLRLSGSPYDAARATRQLETFAAKIDRPLLAWDAVNDDGDVDDERSSPRIPSPTHGWDYAHGVEVTARRLRYFGTQRAKEAYDVMIVGGSVAGGFHRDGRARLAELLAADPRLAGRPIEVINLAHGGFKQPQQLHQVAYFLAIGFEPDAVVDLDGFNEVAIGNQNAAGFGAHPLHPSLAHWGHLVMFGLADAEMLDRMAELRRLQERARTLVSAFRTWRWSAVAGRLFLASIYDARDRQVRAHASYSRAIARRGRELGLLGPAFDDDFDAVLDLSVRCWAESSRSLAAICGVHGIQYVHVLQPTLLDAGSKPLTDAERAVSGTLDAWKRAVPPGYRRLRSAGDELHAAGVRFVDASMAFEDVEETLYFDACHFGPAGNVLLAESIASALLEGLPANGRVW